MRTHDIRQAVILAGGLGTRLRPLTDSTPKPMIRVCDKPFLEYIIRDLAANGISEVLILTGYLHEKIESYFGNGKKFGLRIRYSYSPVEADTGTRIRDALPFLDERVLLLYGDNYWPLDLKELVDYYQKRGKRSLVTVYRNLDGYTRNNVFVTKQGIVTRYDRKRTLKRLNGVDIGFFILQKSDVRRLPDTNCSFEDTLIPALIKERQLTGFLTRHRYAGLSNLKRLKQIEEYFSNAKNILLDRDGVINQKPPRATYVTKWKEFIFLPGVIEGLRMVAKKGYRLFIITNQPGVARGFMTKKDLDAIHARMLRVFEKNKVHIESVYTCLHGWDDGCFCRKPNPGLLFQAATDHNFNLRQSFYVGDDERDVEAANRAGCVSVSLTKFDFGPKPDILVATLLELARAV